MRFVSLALLTVASCSTPTEPTPTACPGGQQIACSCEDGSKGAQVCRDDGSGFGACKCYAPESSSSNASSGHGGASASSSSSSGGGQGGASSVVASSVASSSSGCSTLPEDIECVFLDDDGCKTDAGPTLHGFVCNVAPYSDCIMVSPGNPWPYFCCPEQCARTGGAGAMAWCGCDALVICHDPQPDMEPECHAPQLQDAYCCPPP